MPVADGSLARQARAAAQAPWRRSVVPGNRPSWRLRLALTWKRRETCYVRLAEMVGRNASLPEALSQLWRRESRNGKHPNRPLARAYATWHDMVVSGDALLSQAMAPWLPPSELQTIAAGEPSGRLQSALQQTLRLGRANHDLKVQTRKALAYPALLLILVAVLIALVGEFMMPALLKLASPERWASSGPVLFGIYRFYETGGLAWTFGTLVVAIVAAWVSLPRWRGRGRRFADHLFPWSVYRQLEGVRMMLVLTAMLRLTPDLGAAFRVLLSTSTPWLRSKLEPVLLASRQGDTLATAFARSDPSFPSEEIIDDLMLYGSRSANFADVLYERCDGWLADGQARVLGMLGVIRALLMLGVVAVLMLVVTGMAALPKILGAEFGL